MIDFPFGYNLADAPVPGWPGYFVTPNGAVMSRKVRPTRLRQYVNGYGYTWVNLKDGQRRRSAFVHVLILEAFVGPRPEDGHHARHLDGDQTNNTLGNLAWGSAEENGQDRVRHGTSRRGEGRLTAEERGAIRARHRRGGTSYMALAREYGVSKSWVAKIVRESTNRP